MSAWREAGEQQGAEMTAHKARGARSIGLAVAFGLAFLLCGCDKPSPEEIKSKKIFADLAEATERLNRENAIHAADANADKAPSSGPQKWDYSDNVDNMSGTTSHFASLNSGNILNFDLPYYNQTATLTLVRDTDGKVNAWISVKAQFSGYYPNGIVRVKFDNDKVEWWSCHEILGASPGTLYIDNERRFIKRLVKAKKLLVEARFYPSDRKQMKFNVAGLEWK